MKNQNPTVSEKVEQKSVIGSKCKDIFVFLSLNSIQLGILYIYSPKCMDSIS